ncbi:hypothetical protein C0J45_3499 [Silurus meridionalis]|nr:hypothetical protein C0J45_3499 [Silurus meridionalis]
MLHLGEHRVFVDEGTEQRIRPEKVITHPKYNDRTYDNDFMLIKLSQPAVFNQYVQPIPLASSCVAAGEECLVSGWGNQINTGVGSHDVFDPVSVAADFRINTRSSISFSMPEPLNTPGGPMSKLHTCSGIQMALGDSGGPVVCNGQLKAVVSWGDGCALPGLPGVYAEVCRYTDWVKNIMATN